MSLPSTMTTPLSFGDCGAGNRRDSRVVADKARRPGVDEHAGYSGVRRECRSIVFRVRRVNVVAGRTSVAVARVEPGDVDHAVAVRRDRGKELLAGRAVIDRDGQAEGCSTVG